MAKSRWPSSAKILEMSDSVEGASVAAASPRSARLAMSISILPAKAAKLAGEGMTMNCVTHEMGFARNVSDRVAYFHREIVEEIGPPEQIFGNSGSLLTQKFLANVR